MLDWLFGPRSTPEERAEKAQQAVDTWLANYEKRHPRKSEPENTTEEPKQTKRQHD